MITIKNKWILILTIIVQLCKVPVVKSHDIKIWRTDTNFLNPRNWDKDQLPCANDRVIFPATVPMITFMPESFAASELVLPVDGEIIFPANAAIELTGGTRHGTCRGKDVHFRITIDYWFEPTNWNITSDNAFPRIPNRRNAAVPHAFQVPCPTDRVSFPAGKTFRVHLDYPSTSIAAIDINDVAYTQNEFEALLASRVGSLLFPNNPSIRITSALCSDETGCSCGNDDRKVLPTICQFVTPLCPTLECSDPTNPIGNCCPICGATITLQYQERFKLEQLLKLHESILTKVEFEGVESFTSKTSDGSIQSVFVDGTRNKGNANRAAQLIYDALVKDMEGARIYRIRSKQILKSEKWEAGVPTYDQITSSGMSSGGVAALVIMLIAGVGFCVAFFIYKKRHIPGFNFARFDLLGDKIELELGTTPHDELQPGDTPPPDATAAGNSDEATSKGFDNPVYGTTVEEVPSVVAESTDGKDFVENPMFMIFEDSPDSTKD